MAYKAGDTLFGFTVMQVRESAELGGTVWELTHNGTGAEVCWVDNGERNKLFSIIFKTLPEDSTGVFHILEHSVLCGSEKYPVKEPFVELLKSSMNTFLNAMTAQDWTMYPVSSRNEQDFLNLTGVYLDAVFAPAILSNPNIFYQEGWHIEQDENGGLSYKGVVFNEMKGALSSDDGLIDEKLLTMLFPGTCYGHNSGGDPKVIPTLTYEQFTDTYRRYYHPSNSRVFLDGAVPLEKTLSLLDSYFSKFSRGFVAPQVPTVLPVSREATQYYETAQGESMENKGRLTLAKLIGNWKDGVRGLAVSVLNDFLAGTNESPLKRAVLSAGLAQNLTIGLEDYLAQSYFVLTAKDVKDGAENELRALIRDTVRGLLEKGLDRAALTASVNSLEFRLREPDEPQGLLRCMRAVSGWLHGGDPLNSMVYDEDFKALRAMLETDGFERILREMLADDEGMVILHTLPSETLGEEQRALEAERLKAIGDSWTAEDRAANAEMNRALSAWQQSEDTPEQLATLPMLDLSEVSPEPEFTPTEASGCEGVTVLYHPASCRGIVHYSLYFALTDCTKDELTMLSRIGGMLGMLATEKHDALELQRLLKTYVGRMEFGVEVREKKGCPGRCTPYLTAKCSVLEENLKVSQELMYEILMQTRFDDTGKIREILQQAELRARQIGVTAGHRIGMLATLSHYSAAGAANEALNGYTAVQWLHGMVKNFDERIGAFQALNARLRSERFCRAGMTVSITAAETVDMAAWIAGFPEGKAVPADTEYTSALPMRMGCPIPAQISFAVQGWRTAEEGIPYRGSFKVAANIISLSYLWNVVRVQGGAYGTGMSAASSGNVITYSYRDPSPAASLKANGSAGAFLRRLAESGEPVDKYIISAIAAEEPLLSPREQGDSADREWFSGYTREDAVLFRRQMLDTTCEDLKAYADIADTFAAKGAVCVTGHADALKEFEDLTILEL